MEFGLFDRGYRFRVYLFAGLWILLSVTSFSLTFAAVWYAREVASQLVEKDIQARERTRSLVDLLLAMDRDHKKYQLLGKPAYRERFLENAKRFRQEHARLPELGLEEAEGKVWRQIGDAFEQYMAGEPLETGGDHQASSGVSDLPLAEAHRLLRLNQDRMDLRIEQTNRFATKTLQVGLLWAALSAVAAVLLSFLLIRSITRPIDQLRRGTREIAEGRFSHRVEPRSRDELGELAEAFNEMAEQLKQLDDMKSDFVAIVSHELKTPLTSMKEAVELLREETVGGVNAKQRQLLDISAAGIEKLSGFVEDMLNLTRMEGGLAPLYKTRFDLRDLLEEKLRTFRLLADKKSIELSSRYWPGPPPPVVGDSERLRQVFANLLRNAIHFTPEGGSVTLSVMHGPNVPPPPPGVRGPLRQEEAFRWITVRLTDTGTGIPREEWRRVFDKFYQIRRTSSGGSGLGLTIASRIVEAHGGAIWVEDSSESGTTFVLALPQEIGRDEEAGWEQPEETEALAAHSS